MVGVHRGEEDRAHAAVGEGAGEEVALGGRAVRSRRQVLDRDELQQPLVAAAHGVGDVQVDDVPMHVAGLHLRAYLGEAAVVVLQPHLDPGLRRERLVIRLLAGQGVGAAKGNHGQRPVGRGRHAEQRGQQRRRAGGPERPARSSHHHVYLSGG